MNPAEKKILTAFKKLSKADRENLQVFGEFLLSRQKGQTLEDIPEPQLTPRGENESVVAALKRLSASYPMLDKPELLNESSTLMTQHVMQGRDVNEVIDDLETLFDRFYQQLLSKVAGGDAPSSD